MARRTSRSEPRVPQRTETDDRLRRRLRRSAVALAEAERVGRFPRRRAAARAMAFAQGGRVDLETGPERGWFPGRRSRLGRRGVCGRATTPNRGRSLSSGRADMTTTLDREAPAGEARLGAQRRVDQINAFTRELAELEREGILALAAGPAGRVERHHAGLLADARAAVRRGPHRRAAPDGARHADRVAARRRDAQRRGRAVLLPRVGAADDAGPGGGARRHAARDARRRRAGGPTRADPLHRGGARRSSPPPASP